MHCKINYNIPVLVSSHPIKQSKGCKPPLQYGDLLTFVPTVTAFGGEGLPFVVSVKAQTEN